jgi:hypothetical protein
MEIPTSFVEVSAFVQTQNIPRDLRLYLPLYLDLVFDSDLNRDGKIVPHTDVNQELEKETLEYYATLLGGTNCVR